MCFACSLPAARTALVNIARKNGRNRPFAAILIDDPKLSFKMTSGTSYSFTVQLPIKAETARYGRRLGAVYIR